MADALDFQKGTLDLMILKILSWGTMHGYAIGLRIEHLTDNALRPGEGTLYPALYRLEARRFVTMRSGITSTKREARFYRITALGRKRLVTAEDEWSRFSAALAAVLTGKPEPARASSSSP